MAWKCAECGSENSEDSMRCTCSHVRQIDYEQKETSRVRVFPWVGTILSVGGFFYCFLGFAMVASFSVATPEGKSHWEFMAWVYLAGMATCSLLAILFVVSIIRKRLKESH